LGNKVFIETTVRANVKTETVELAECEYCENHSSEVDVARGQGGGRTQGIQRGIPSPAIPYDILSCIFNDHA